MKTKLNFVFLLSYFSLLNAQGGWDSAAQVDSKIDSILTEQEQVESANFLQETEDEVRRVHERIKADQQEWYGDHTAELNQLEQMSKSNEAAWEAAIERREQNKRELEAQRLMLEQSQPLAPDHDLDAMWEQQEAEFQQTLDKVNAELEESNTRAKASMDELYARLEIERQQYIEQFGPIQ